MTFTDTEWLASEAYRQAQRHADGAASYERMARRAHAAGASPDFIRGIAAWADSEAVAAQECAGFIKRLMTEHKATGESEVCENILRNYRRQAKDCYHAAKRCAANAAALRSDATAMQPAA